MVLFFTILLGISVVGLSGLLGVRRYEVVSGRVIFAQVRPTLGAWLGSGMHFVERVAPAIVRYWGTLVYRRVRHELHRAVAWSVLLTEKSLEQTLDTLRHTTAPKESDQPSAFLREVAEHKKQLQEGSDKRAIYDHPLE